VYVERLLDAFQDIWSMVACKDEKTGEFRRRATQILYNGTIYWRRGKKRKKKDMQDIRLIYEEKKRFVFYFIDPIFEIKNINIYYGT